MKWYAAFHNTTHHPHIHLVVYSENIKHGYLTKKGIDSLHRTFANDIYRNEMYHLFTLQTHMRNEVKQEAQRKIDGLIKHASENIPCSENFNNLVSLLSEQLKKHKGKKLYGYLQKNVKNTVDAIVKELARDNRIADFYTEWNDLNFTTGELRIERQVNVFNGEQNAYGKREAHNIYAKTREECEEKLAAIIIQVKAYIKAEKERLKTMNETFSLEIR